MSVKPWAGAKAYASSTVNSIGVDGDDSDRIRAYDVYEGFYWSAPDSFRIVQRGQDSRPIYLPSTRRIIEVTQRFLAVNWDYIVDPRNGSAEDQANVDLLFRRLFAREMMYAKFVTQKRYGLIRGDAFWHVLGDPARAATERISIKELKPQQVFPILDPDDDTRVIGYHILDLIKNPANPQTQAVRRQTYRRDAATRTVTSSLGAYELGKWDDRLPEADITKIQDIVPEFQLPSEIDQLPVYHVRNQRDSDLWGSSQVRGVETVIAAVNQAVSDQDLTLALQGLGLYWTDSGPAIDPVTKQPVQANIGPGQIIEVFAGSTFNRVSGITALPAIEHMKFMSESLDSGLGIPAAAAGNVDVTVAASGISLFLQMAPLLSANSEKESELLGVMDHMLYDILNKWFPAYEGLGLTGCEVASVVGDAMPRDRESEITEVISLITSVPPLITIEMAQVRLAELGYAFPKDAANQVLSEAQAVSSAQNSDPFANRFQTEVNNEPAALPNRTPPIPRPAV